MLVELKDGESGVVYRVEMSVEEWERCDSDLLYAQELLEKAREDNQENILTCESEQVEKHVWTYDQTIKLIDSVESHYEELTAINPKIKKKGWENILNDVISSAIGISVTIAEIKRKWANLIQSYKKAKDINNKTGRGPTRFCFFEKIDSIVGNKPTNCSPHSFNLGTLAQSTVPKVVTTSNELERHEKEAEAIASVSVDRGEEDSSGSTTPSSKKRIRNTPNQEYVQSKISYLKKKEERMEKRELLKKQKEDKKEEREKEKQEMLRRKLLLEERKVTALEQYIALKKKD